MKILDNINHTVREDLQDTMQKGSRVSIAAACFSIYAYQELKKQLEEIAELRFIFTSPTFVQENTPKERRLGATESKISFQRQWRANARFHDGW